MTPKFDETNVFKIPHGRMKQLVNTCNNKLIVTDFANNDQLFKLLTSLQGVFNEFKSHEEIENKFIMTKLKSKLKALAIHNSAVCNCHTKDEFTPLLDLVDTGYLHVNKTKTTSERISFGVKLRKEINQFTRRFVPHMEEEEEIFQPLLMKYFSEQELVEMKIIVIKSHMQQRKAPNSSREFNNHDLKSDDNDDSKSHIDDLPSEIFLKIFSNLNNSDLLKVAQVSRRWNDMVYDKSNWNSLDISNWITRKENFDIDSLNEPSFGFKDIEYLDDSDEEFEEESQIQEDQIKLLQFWIKKLLPRVGTQITELDISYCKSLSNNLARRILQFCPNLKTLNLSYTNIGDNSFRGVKLNYLEHFNCEGCENLSDKAFKYLLESKKNAQQRANCSKKPNSKDELEQSHCRSCVDNKNSIEEIHKPNNSNERQEMHQPGTSLKYINLSGCWSITDSGLELIASKFNLKNLNYLNLSGCLNISSEGMTVFITESDGLNGENVYYCDNIDDGPLRDTANGCANLESNKFCCRSGE